MTVRPVSNAGQVLAYLPWKHPGPVGTRVHHTSLAGRRLSQLGQRGFYLVVYGLHGWV